MTLNDLLNLGDMGLLVDWLQENQHDFELVKKNDDELLSCPDCGADPQEFCVVNSSKSRETHDKNYVVAECKMCGFTVALSSRGNMLLIRKLWNTARS